MVESTSLQTLLQADRALLVAFAAARVNPLAPPVVGVDGAGNNENGEKYEEQLHGSLASERIIHAPDNGETRRGGL